MYISPFSPHVSGIVIWDGSVVRGLQECQLHRDRRCPREAVPIVQVMLIKVTTLLSLASRFPDVKSVKFKESPSDRIRSAHLEKIDTKPADRGSKVTVSLQHWHCWHTQHPSRTVTVPSELAARSGAINFIYKHDQINY